MSLIIFAVFATIKKMNNIKKLLIKWLLDFKLFGHPWGCLGYVQGITRIEAYTNWGIYPVETYTLLRHIHCRILYITYMLYMHKYNSIFLKDILKQKISYWNLINIHINNINIHVEMNKYKKKILFMFNVYVVYYLTLAEKTDIRKKPFPLMLDSAWLE